MVVSFRRTLSGWLMYYIVAQRTTRRYAGRARLMTSSSVSGLELRVPPASTAVTSPAAQPVLTRREDVPHSGIRCRPGGEPARPLQAWLLAGRPC